MTDTDKDKPEVIEERMGNALKRALHTPPKPFTPKQKKGDGPKAAPQ